MEKRKKERKREKWYKERVSGWAIGEDLAVILYIGGMRGVSTRSLKGRISNGGRTGPLPSGHTHTPPTHPYTHTHPHTHTYNNTYTYTQCRKRVKL